MDDQLKVLEQGPLFLANVLWLRWLREGCCELLPGVAVRITVSGCILETAADPWRSLPVQSSGAGCYDRDPGVARSTASLLARQPGHPLIDCPNFSSHSRDARPGVDLGATVGLSARLSGLSAVPCLLAQGPIFGSPSVLAGTLRPLVARSSRRQFSGGPPPCAVRPVSTSRIPARPRARPFILRFLRLAHLGRGGADLFGA